MPVAHSPQKTSLSIKNGNGRPADHNAFLCRIAGIPESKDNAMRHKKCYGQARENHFYRGQAGKGRGGAKRDANEEGEVKEKLVSLFPFALIKLMRKTRLPITQNIL